ncbi:MAG: alpha/beta fold hydrolase [Nocardioides sp.]
MYDFADDVAVELTPRADVDGRHHAPHAVLTALELPRWIGEYSTSRILDGALTRTPIVHGRLDVGQGRPVLVLPGFAANDQMTGRLRGHLKSRGFRVHGWRLGRNIGLTDRLVDGLTERFEQVADQYDQPISIVGWSFGGVLARRLAHEHTERVARIVCLGSPWRADGERTRATGMFERSREKHGISDRALDLVTRLREPVPVPTTAIYSRTDGIVPWQGCRVDERAEPLAENVEVLSSHMGMVANPLVLRLVVDRLRRDVAVAAPVPVVVTA